MSEATPFFESVLAAGAILSGFCGTFLSFRINRESNYYRQPALSYEEENAKDIYIGRTHFTSSFLLLSLATLCSIAFGVLFPLFAVAGSAWISARPEIVVAGLVATLVLILAYFLDELVHYRILSNKLMNDVHEWGAERWIVVGGIALAVVGAGTAWWAFCRSV